MLEDGGIHAHGIHKDEAIVKSWAGVAHGFMEGVGDREVQGRVWAGVFEFYRKHIKEI